MTTQAGDTITRLIATPTEARELAERLVRAAEECDRTDETAHVRMTLQQSKYEGPWGLAIHITN